MTSPKLEQDSKYSKLERHHAAGDRRLGIGGSDATRIAKGEWLDLYREKTGETSAPDLSGIFRVQLGVLTEPLHRSWHARQTECGIVHDGFPQWNPAYNNRAFMYASLDGWVPADDCPLELKHTNEHNNLRNAAQYYMAQLQHIMLVTSTPRMRFSIIRGNNEPEWGYVDADPEYQRTLVGMEDQFWWHVTERVPPENTNSAAQAELEALAPKIPINGFKPYDYDTNNMFVDLAASYVINKDAAARFDAAKKELKELVPADASEVTCRHLTIKRSANGSLRFGEPT